MNAKLMTKSFKLCHIFELHSPCEIISTMCKTEQDALWKWKPCRELFIHISNKSASNKLKNVSMESSKLLCLDGALFCSITKNDLILNLTPENRIE